MYLVPVFLVKCNYCLSQRMFTKVRPMRLTYFLLQSSLILFFHFVILELSGAAGGEIGMVPLLTIYAIAIQSGILLLLYLIGGVLFNYKNRLVWIGAAALVFELAILFITGAPGIAGIFDNGTNGIMSRSFFLPNFIATIITLLVSGIGKK